MVVVCPGCREHAQITEAGKKTLSCQHCGARLQARKLRVFYYSDELAEAVAFRTSLQAELSGKGKGGAAGKYSFAEKPCSENPRKKLKVPASQTSKAAPPTKDPGSIIAGLLEAAGGKMKLEDLREKALEKGISPEKFDKTLEKLLEAGNIYSPSPGEIKPV